MGLDASLFGTHSLRRTKATLIYRRTGNLRAVQLLLGHTKVESTVRYLGIEVDDALAIAAGRGLWTTFRYTKLVYLCSGQVVEICSGVDTARGCPWTSSPVQRAMLSGHILPVAMAAPMPR